MDSKDLSISTTPEEAPFAGAPGLMVQPWNGRRAAVSLTFDDGDPSHLVTAIPEMDAHRVKGTFFLIAGSVSDWPAWKKARADGHEIASHSMTHPHAEGLTPDEIGFETLTARKRIEAECGPGIVTFAYPYAELTPALEDAVDRLYLAARGAHGESFYLAPSDTPSWANIPAQVARTDAPIETYAGWIADAQEAGAWTVFLMHNVGVEHGYEPISRETFVGILERLQASEAWVAPFGTVAAYWRAQKVVEAAAAGKGRAEVEIAWSIPENFPAGVVLRITVPGAPDDARVTQGDKTLLPDADGVYAVSFDAGRLSIRR